MKWLNGGSLLLHHSHSCYTLSPWTSDDENYPRQRCVIDRRSLKTTAAWASMSTLFTQTCTFLVKPPAAFKWLPLIENGKQSLLIDSFKGGRERARNRDRERWAGYLFQFSVVIESTRGTIDGGKLHLVSLSADCTSVWRKMARSVLREDRF